MQDVTKTYTNKSRFVLMSDKNDAKYRLKIHSCTLLVQRIKLVEAIKLALQTTIESNHKVFCYPLRHARHNEIRVIDFWVFKFWIQQSILWTHTQLLNHVHC